MDRTVNVCDSNRRISYVDSLPEIFEAAPDEAGLLTVALKVRHPTDEVTQPAWRDTAGY